MIGLFIKCFVIKCVNKYLIHYDHHHIYISINTIYAYCQQIHPVFIKSLISFYTHTEKKQLFIISLSGNKAELSWGHHKLNTESPQ